MGELCVVFSSSILVGDGGGVTMIRSMLVGEGFVVEGIVSLVNEVDLNFLGGLETKVTFSL